MFRKFFSVNKVVAVVTLKRYHFLILIAIFLASILLYSIYFRHFMTLPQSAINIMPQFPFSLEKQKILVFAPHCDDEILGAGGLMERAINSGSEVKVVMVTDCNRHKNGLERKQETISGLKKIGVSSDNIIFLKFPEKKENYKNGDTKQVQLMSVSFKDEIDDFKPTLIISPHPQDSHIDHSTTGKIVEKEVNNRSLKIPIAFYLIHYNFLKYPSLPGFHPEDYLLPPARLITFNEGWYQLPLTTQEEDLKEEAVLQYQSQLKMTNPILYRILFDFIRRNELFMIRR